MYHSSTTCVEKEVRVEDDWWTKTLVPGGERGVALKSKFPLMAVWAESLGFVQEY